jgi:catechol 2,3-dioxygenase-like lactoylglutathione lyase family enzyme
MVKHFDHVTVVVNNVEEAKVFFALLGFEEERSLVISGERMSTYMGIDEIEAEHVTLVLANASPRLEVQLLEYRRPVAVPDPNVAPNRVGFNHICFTVEDIDGEVRKLRAAGVSLRNEIMQFNDRKLVFLSGPAGITVELAQWLVPT